MSNIKERLNAPDGYASQVSSFKGFLRFHGGFHLGKGYFFEPAFGTMLPPRNGADGSTTAFRSHLDLNLGIPLSSVIRFRTGPGIQWDLYRSQGGSANLGNGTSAGEDFPIPDRTTNVFLFTVQGGFSFLFSKRMGLYLDFYVPQLFSSIRRRYHASATLGFTL